MPITVAIYCYSDSSRGFLTRWTFTPEERERIAAGEDVYVHQLNFLQPNGRYAGMTPLSVSCGPGGYQVPMSCEPDA
jgi:hypothetical protein